MENLKNTAATGENTATPAVSDAEFNAAVEEALAAPVGGYTHTFKTPFKWQGKEYTTLHFDFDSLTGDDMLQVEQVLAMRGIALVSPTMSGHFLLIMAGRAAGVGDDMIRAMRLPDANTIRSKMRNFLLRSEL